MTTFEQMHKMKTQPEFVAALDQSGGSTPQALALYGIRVVSPSNRCGSDPAVLEFGIL
jgi:fructose-bisphosphate aldolase class 1